MTDKQPVPEYDESIVQRLPYGGDGPREYLKRWSGGYFEEGRRNGKPHRGSDNRTPDKQ